MDARRIIAFFIVLAVLGWGAALFLFYNRMHAAAMRADAYGKYARHGGRFQITVDVADERCSDWLLVEYQNYKKKSLITPVVGFVLISLAVYPINEYLVE